MKQTINQYAFEQAFRDSSRKDTFSYAGLKALFEYLEQYEEDSGEEVELDVIALCCEYTEYENLKEFQDAYSEEWKTLEDIEDSTQVIRIDNGRFIIQDF